MPTADSNKHTTRGNEPVELALGFIRLPDKHNDALVRELEKAMDSFAASHGLQLTKIFYEFRVVSYDVFEDLIVELRRGDVHHVIVPALSHFAETRVLQNIYLNYLEAQAGAEVFELGTVED